MHFHQLLGTNGITWKRRTSWTSSESTADSLYVVSVYMCTVCVGVCTCIRMYVCKYIRMYSMCMGVGVHTEVHYDHSI